MNELKIILDVKLMFERDINILINRLKDRGYIVTYGLIENSKGNIFITTDEYQYDRWMQYHPDDYCIIYNRRCGKLEDKYGHKYCSTFDRLIGMIGILHIGCNIELNNN